MKTDKKIETKREVTKLFKKWFVRRDNGNCQVLFALTELDDFVDEIDAIYNTEVQKAVEEKADEITRHYDKQVEKKVEDGVIEYEKWRHRQLLIENGIDTDDLEDCYDLSEVETYLQSLKDKDE